MRPYGASLWDKCMFCARLYVYENISCTIEDGNRNLKQKFWGFDSGVIVHKIKLSTDDFVIEII